MKEDGLKFIKRKIELLKNAYIKVKRKLIEKVNGCRKCFGRS